MEPCLAIDTGGTRIKLGIVADGRVLARETIDAHSDRGLAARLPEISENVRNLCARVGIAVSDCRAVGVSFPALMDPVTNRVRTAYGKYEDATDVDLVGWAEREFGLPLFIENDARAALLGEWRYGAGRGSRDLVMITLGTGIGTSAVVEGRMLRGVHGQAGCLGGHLTVRYGGRDCACGNVGCAEAEAATASLRQIVADRPDFTASALSAVDPLDYAAIFAEAEKGDACAVALRDHSLLVWSSLVVNLIHAYDPEIVILGGGIMRSAATILPSVADYVARHAHTPWGKVDIRLSELGDDAALLGCAVLLEEQPLSSE